MLNDKTQKRPSELESGEPEPHSLIKFSGVSLLGPSLMLLNRKSKRLTRSGNGFSTYSCERTAKDSCDPDLVGHRSRRFIIRLVIWTSHHQCCQLWKKISLCPNGQWVQKESHKNFIKLDRRRKTGWCNNVNWRPHPAILHYLNALGSLAAQQIPNKMCKITA